MSLDVGVRAADLIRDLFNRSFDDTAGSVVSAITRSSNSGIIKKRLSELTAEAQLLAEAGKRIEADNAILRALLADMDDVIATNVDKIRLAGGGLQNDAFSVADLANRQLMFEGIDDATRTLLSAQWNNVDPQVMKTLVDYVDSAAWEQQLSQYGDDVVQKIRGITINGQIAGWSPNRVADAIVNSVQGKAGGAGFPSSQAENLMRTLQMQSFRTAQTINRVANADILESQIRISALDNACLACVALHGESFPIDQRIDDHHRGRCTSIPVIKNRPRTIESGQEWWDNRTPEQKLAQAGPANYAALEAGAVSLPDYVQPYKDDVFGDMLRESSLSGILGDSAKEYYT